MSIEDMLPVPTDDERTARRADLLSRARTVRARGWDDYLYTWSTGEVLAVALLLGTDDVLTEFGETPATVLSRWAYDLFGMRAARADVDAGAPATIAWFDDTRAQLT